MKVTLITATYNSGDTLTACLDSVAGQSHRNIEHLIIDGASTDNTRDLVDAYRESSINVVFKSEPDKGIYDALNKGIKLATGDIIGFLHSDDFLDHPEILSEIVQSIQSTSSSGVYGDLLYVNRSDPTKVFRFWKGEEYNRRLLTRGWMPAHPTLFLKKEVYQKHGCFDLSFKIAADYEFMLRVLKDPEMNFHYLSKVFVRMRTGGASNKNLNNLWKKSTEDYRAMRKHKIPYPGRALLLKNLSKVPQFFKHSEKLY